MTPSVVKLSGLAQIGDGLVYGHGGPKVIVVHHSGPGNLDDAPPWFHENGRTSVQLALDLCRSGRGDIVQMLPGHAETIGADAWSNLGTKTGVRVLGPAFGPPATLTWSSSSSTLLMDAADFVIDGQNNLTLQMEPTTGTVTVTAPITISAARCKLLNARCMAGTDTDNKVTIGITSTANADDLEIGGIHMFSATAAEATTFMQFVGADRLYFHDNVIMGATSAVSVGVVRFLTTASTHIRMLRNTLKNFKAASETVLTGMAGCNGFVDDLHLMALANGAAQLVIGGANSAILLPGDLQFGANVFVTNTTAETAAKMTPVSA